MDGTDAQPERAAIALGLAAHRYPPVADVARYLSLGFIPDERLASDYVTQLFADPVPTSDEGGKLLTQIVADLTAGAAGVAIPITAGKDSRALLAAALGKFSPRDIHCFTFGSRSYGDVRGGRLAAERAGVAHSVVDPNSFEWNIDDITRQYRRLLHTDQGVPPIDGLVVFDGLAKVIPQELTVLSGFLGDAVSGKHLAGGGLDNDQDQVLARFYQRNAVALNDRPEDLFRTFLARHAHLKERWPGLSSYDLVDFGFRQRLRIRAVVTSAFQNVVRPYEDVRWIAHWFSKPLSERLGQRAYERELRQAFPRLFPPATHRATFDNSSAYRLAVGVARRLRAIASGAGKATASPWIAPRGDPRINTSMASVLEAASSGFDKRGICPAGTATDAFESLMRAPSRARFTQVRWLATAEILLRVGDNAPVHDFGKAAGRIASQGART